MKRVPDTHPWFPLVVDCLVHGHELPRALRQRVKREARRAEDEAAVREDVEARPEGARSWAPALLRAGHRLRPCRRRGRGGVGQVGLRLPRCLRVPEGPAREGTRYAEVIWLYIFGINPLSTTV